MKKTNSKNHDFVKNIISGIISTLIISWIISPITDFVFPKIISFANKFSLSLSNQIYSQVSKGSYEYISALNLTYSHIIVLILFSSLTLSVYLGYLSLKDHISELEDLIYDKEEEEEESDEEFIKSIQNDLRQQKKRLPFYKYLSIFFLFFIFVTTTFTTMKQIYILGLSTKATVNIEIVSPYITDIEYKQLKSSFHLIKTQDDYEKLLDKIQDIADANEINLSK